MLESVAYDISMLVVMVIQCQKCWCRAVLDVRGFHDVGKLHPDNKKIHFSVAVA